MSRPYRICFVCLGNICRSPTAEGVMLHQLNSEPTLRVEVDSAGTDAWHAGETADSRAQSTARKRQITLPSRARQFKARDFETFDLILAMDRENLSQLQKLANSKEQRLKLRLFRDFDSTIQGAGDVPDPYYGGKSGFEEVFDMCERTCRSLIEYIKREHLQ